MDSKNIYSNSYDFIIFSNLFPPDGGGLERAAESLSKFLANEKKRKVIVVSSGDEDQFYKDEAVYCLKFNSFKIFHGFYPLIGIKMIFSALKLIKHNPETRIIIYGRHFTQSIFISLLCKGLNRKYTYIDTGFEPEVFKNKALNLVLNILDLTIFRLVISFASLRIFVSETSKRFVVGRYGKWLEDAKVILNGFDEQIVEKFPFEIKHKNVVFASRLVNVKNPDTTIDAYIKLANKYPDWNFYLIGKGKCKLDEVSPDALPENLIYQNKLLPQAEFHALLAKSAIYINSSISEGLPLSIVEAGGLGCILVLSNIPHNMEVANIAGLEKYSFTAKQVDELVQRLELAIMNSEFHSHKQIQSNSLKEFANTNVLAKYWTLLN